MERGDEVLQSWIVDGFDAEPFNVHVAEELIDVAEVSLTRILREAELEAEVREELRAYIVREHSKSENFNLSLQR